MYKSLKKEKKNIRENNLSKEVKKIKKENQ